MSRFTDKSYGLVTAVDYRKRKARIFYWAMFTLLLICALITVMPVIWVLFSSVKSMEEFLAVPPTFFPKTFEPGKVVDTWNELKFGGFYMNSLIIAFGSIASVLAFDGIAGYVLSRLQPKGTKLILLVILWTMMMPTTLNLVPLFANFLDFSPLHLNLSNTYWPLWIMRAADCMNIMLFKNFFDSISTSYIEAAKIDGATNVGIFGKIILPISKPIIAVVVIRTAVTSWNEFLWPYILIRSDSIMPVSVKLFYMKTTFSMDKQVIASFFAILPPIILFLIFQKQIMYNATSAGVKG